MILLPVSAACRTVGFLCTTQNYSDLCQVLLTISFELFTKPFYSSLAFIYLLGVLVKVCDLL